MKKWLSDIVESVEDGTVTVESVEDGTVTVTVEVPDDPVLIDQTYEMAPVGSLTTHPENPRLGNIAAIRESIHANGFYGVCVVQRSSGHILVGNHRYIAAVEEGLGEVPVMWLDVDDEEARRLLIADNRTSDLGAYNDALLISLLTEQSDQGGLDGTAWKPGDVDKLLAALDKDSPTEFPEITVDDLGLEYQCPSCHYEWGGDPRPTPKTVKQPITRRPQDSVVWEGDTSG